MRRAARADMYVTRARPSRRLYAAGGQLAMRACIPVATPRRPSAHSTHMPMHMAWNARSMARRYCTSGAWALSHYLSSRTAVQRVLRSNLYTVKIGTKEVEARYIWHSSAGLRISPLKTTYNATVNTRMSELMLMLAQWSRVRAHV